MWNDCPICGKKLQFDSQCRWMVCYYDESSFHYIVSFSLLGDSMFNFIEYEEYYLDDRNAVLSRQKNWTMIYSHFSKIDIPFVVQLKNSLKETIDKLLLLS